MTASTKQILDAAMDEAREDAYPESMTSKDVSVAFAAIDAVAAHVARCLMAEPAPIRSPALPTSPDAGTRPPVHYNAGLGAREKRPHDHQARQYCNRSGKRNGTLGGRVWRLGLVNYAIGIRRRRCH